MKDWLPKVVIGLSLALCALCAFQWAREARLRRQVQALRQSAQEDARRITHLTAERERAWTAVHDLEQQQALSQSVAGSNQTHLAELQTLARRLAAERDHLARQLEIHKASLADANRSIVQQNEAIRAQNKVTDARNETLKQLVAERDQYLERLNQRTKEYNDLAEKYNLVVARLEAELKRGRP